MGSRSIRSQNQSLRLFISLCLFEQRYRLKHFAHPHRLDINSPRPRLTALPICKPYQTCGPCILKNDKVPLHYSLHSLTSLASYHTSVRHSLRSSRFSLSFEQPSDPAKCVHPTAPRVQPNRTLTVEMAPRTRLRQRFRSI